MEFEGTKYASRWGAILTLDLSLDFEGHQPGIEAMKRPNGRLLKNSKILMLERVLFDMLGCHSELWTHLPAAFVP